MTLVKKLLAIALVILILKLYFKLRVKWCKSKETLFGKTVIITGANTGIGYETALDLAKRGAKVILACRNNLKGCEAARKIIQQTGNVNVTVKQIDLLSFASVQKFAKEIKTTEERLDILVNNAGACSLPVERTKDGHFQLLQTNYLSPFLLTNLLLDLLIKTKNSRIVNVASIAAESARLKLNKLHKYKGDNAEYCNSKLCNILFTRELADRLDGTSVTTYSVHPGYCNTEIFRHLSPFLTIMYNVIFRFFFNTPREGAQTVIYACVTKNIEKFNGEHLSNCSVVEPYETVNIIGLSKKLWIKSERLVNLVSR